MYKLEIDRIVKEIQVKGSKTVLVQLPDGLKTRAQELVDTLEKETGADVFIWLTSCFGACDLPLGMDAIGIDQIIAFGHNQFHKLPEGW